MRSRRCAICASADDARFAITEAKWSRGAPWAAPLPWLIPPRVALELIVTAEPLSAERAHAIGLVNRVVPRARLLEEAQALARVIAKNAPLSVRAGKRMVYAVAGASLASAFDAGDRVWESVYESEDAQEGPRAFREKRAPVWRAR